MRMCLLFDENIIAVIVQASSRGECRSPIMDVIVSH